MCMNSLRVLIAAMLNISQRLVDDVRLNISDME